MRIINKHFIGGAFADSHGINVRAIHSLTTNQVIGRVTLGKAAEHEMIPGVPVAARRSRTDDTPAPPCSDTAGRTIT
jgi:hypothetical protein